MSRNICPLFWGRDDCYIKLRLVLSELPKSWVLGLHKQLGIGTNWKALFYQGIWARLYLGPCQIHILWSAGPRINAECKTRTKKSWVFVYIASSALLLHMYMYVCSTDIVVLLIPQLHCRPKYALFSFQSAIPKRALRNKVHCSKLMKQFAWAVSGWWKQCWYLYIYKYILWLLVYNKSGALFAWLVWDLVNVVPQCPMPAMATSTGFSIVSVTHENSLDF
jgi:hypothetical protein